MRAPDVRTGGWAARMHPALHGGAGTTGLARPATYFFDGEIFSKTVSCA